MAEVVSIVLTNKFLTIWKKHKTKKKEKKITICKIVMKCWLLKSPIYSIPLPDSKASHSMHRVVGR